MKKNVKVFSTVTCPYCHRLKAFLDENNIEYQNIDVGSDQQGAQEMKNKSGQLGVPVIEIDDKIIVGFNKEEMTKELGI